MSSTSEQQDLDAGDVIVAMDGVRKSFGDTVVLDGIDLNVRRGEVVTLIGPSGAGKSTLLRCVNGLETISGGSITVNGRTLDRTEPTLNAVRAEVGMVFQAFNLFPHLSVERNIMMAQQDVLGRPADEAREKTLALLDRVGLKDRAGSYPGHLSGGQQQRVAIARALAMDPVLMLFDEPTSALDPELVGEVLHVMRDLAEEGMTMMVVTHEMRFARRAAHRVLLLADGGVLEDGPPAQVLDEPRSERGRAFLRRLDET